LQRSEEITDGFGLVCGRDRQADPECPLYSQGQFGAAEAIDAEVAFDAAVERKLAQAARMEFLQKLGDHSEELVTPHWSRAWCDCFFGHLPRFGVPC
jgi:hypothetical protein